MGFISLHEHFVNQRFLPKLANTLDKMRVSLEDKLHTIENISQDFPSIIGFFSSGLKKLISSRLWIHKLVIESNSFLEAGLTFLDLLKLEVLDLIIFETY